MFGTVQDVTERKRVEDALREKSEQLLAVSEALNAFLETGSWHRSSEILLQAALQKTQSEYGFVGVMIEGTLRVLAHAGMIWSQSVNRPFYEAALKAYKERGYLEFPNLKNLFGRVITAGRPVVANHAPYDPRAAGSLPAGHPPLHTFLGVPILKGSEVVGMIALANRPGGYRQQDQEVIETITRAVGVLYDNYRHSMESASLQARQQRTEERYRHLLQAASDAIMVVDVADGVLLDANDRMAELLGVPAGQLPGMREAELYAGGEGAASAQLLRNAASGRQGRINELTLRRRDGRSVTVEASARISDIDGRPVLLSIFRDVSEVKRLNRALKALSRCNQVLVRARDEVELLEEICRTIVTAGEYRLAWVAEGVQDAAKTVRVVAQAGDTSGYLEAARIEWGDTTYGRGPAGTALRTGKVCIVSDTEDDANFAPWRALAAAADHRSCIALPLHQDGEVCCALMIYSSGVAFFDADEVDLLRELAGNVAYGIEALRSRSKRTRAETEVAALSEQLRQAQKMESLGRLAGGIAHDFNNLLTVIRGYAELASPAPGGDPELERKVRAILHASDRAQTLVAQLLAFSRKQVLQPTVMDLNHILAEVTTMLPRLIGEHIRLDVQPGGEVPKIKADPTQIQQVIINLAVNARDAMPKGGTLLIATSGVTLGAAGDWALLTVRDSGSGIAPDIQGRIFEPFFTTKDVGQGTGLGLSMVYGTVSQSDGHIEVESTPNQGTTFKIYFPATMATPAVPEPIPRASRRVGNAASILLVEDESTVRDMLSEFLRDRGYQVTTAENGQDGLDKIAARSEAFDLVISDAIMPGLGGREMVARIRQTHPNMKVLLMSGYVADMLVRRDIAEHVEQYIEKPFHLDSLAAAVNRLLDS